MVDPELNKQKLQESLKWFLKNGESLLESSIKYSLLTCSSLEKPNLMKKYQYFWIMYWKF